MRHKQRIRGVSLIELLVAVTIGGLLIFGATQVYVDSRNAYEVNETAARLQETARYALSVVEPDLRMSNYWGLVKGAGLVTNQALRTEASAGPPMNCGNNFAHDLMLNIEGTNGSSTFACIAYRSNAVTDADTLTVRRASVAPADAATNRLKICSTRIMGELVNNSAGCTGAPAGQVNDLIVNSYYVSQNSTGQPGIPSLRRVALVAGPAFSDEEIIPGVEDMQIQFGVDPTGMDGRATKYVNPDAVDVSEQIISVRIWLLVRSETTEVGFVDGRTYTYGDRTYTPNDGFRRLLISRTIQVRNALGT
jgi:type IV pilus assembly protein PilW